MKILPPLSLLVASCLLVLPAQAQTATPRYAFKELAKPASARYCDPRANVPQRLLNAAGDVVLGCSYVGGIRFGDTTSNGFYNPFAIVQWLHDRPVVWSASGAVREMAFPSKSSFNQLHGITDVGVVYGTAVALNGSGRSKGPIQTHAWQPGGARSLFQYPASAPASQWYVTDVTPSGTVVLSSNEDPKIQLVKDGQARAFPGLPPIGGLTGTFNLVVHDQGLYAASVETANAASWTGLDLQPWFYGSGGWQRITPPEQYTHIYVRDVNARGEVLGTVPPGQDFIWSSATGQNVKLLNLDGAPGSGAVALNDQGVAVGAVARPQGATQGGVSRAVAWINGQVVNLQAATTVPANWVLEGAMAVNEKGQILVSARDTSQSGVGARRFALLTPQ